MAVQGPNGLWFSKTVIFCLWYDPAVVSSPWTHHDVVGLSGLAGPVSGVGWDDALAEQLLHDVTGPGPLGLLGQPWAEAWERSRREGFDSHPAHGESPSKVIDRHLHLLLPASGGSFLCTAPGSVGASPESRPTPLSVVNFDTAESPRSTSTHCLPVSSCINGNAKRIFIFIISNSLTYVHLTTFLISGKKYKHEKNCKHLKWFNTPEWV